MLRRKKSMGGSIACKATVEALNQHYQHRIVGLVVIDVVEGTAMEALPFMEKIVNERPQQFPSLEKAIEWRFIAMCISSSNLIFFSIRSNNLKVLASARVSIPPQLIAAKNQNGDTVYKWKVDLMKSQTHWIGLLEVLIFNCSFL